MACTCGGSGGYDDPELAEDTGVPDDAIGFLGTVIWQEVAVDASICSGVTEVRGTRQTETHCSDCDFVFGIETAAVETVGSCTPVAKTSWLENPDTEIERLEHMVSTDFFDPPNGRWGLATTELWRTYGEGWQWQYIWAELGAEGTEVTVTRTGATFEIGPVASGGTAKSDWWSYCYDWLDSAIPTLLLAGSGVTETLIYGAVRGDVWAVEGVAGEELTVGVSALSPDAGQLVLQLVGPDGCLVLYDFSPGDDCTDFGTTCPTLSWVPPVGGEIRIAVSAYSKPELTYDLRVSGAGEDVLPTLLGDDVPLSVYEAGEATAIAELTWTLP